MMLRPLSGNSRSDGLFFHDAVNDIRNIQAFLRVDKLEYLQTDQFSNQNTLA